MIKREVYQFNDTEFREKQRLPREQDACWDFLRKVSERLGIDYETILPNYEEPHSRRSFTALAKGHNKHWCWPMKLKCTVDPKTIKIDESEYNNGY